MEPLVDGGLNESLVTRLSMSDLDVPINISLQMYGDLICDADWGLVSKPSYHRVYYIKGGRAGFIMDGIKTKFKPGHLYMLPVNQEYELYHDSGNPLECLFMHLHISPLVLNQAICYEVKEHSLTKDCLRIIERIIHFDTIRLDLLMKQIAVLVYSIHDEKALDIVSHREMVEALYYIENNYMNVLTNDMIAARIGFNTNYFIKVFHQVIGVSPQLYLSKYRLTKSIQLILSETPIKSVSEQVGYKDVKAFARFFKRHTGCPPSRYKAERFGKE